MKALILFYEGAHDQAFLSRVLKTLGYEHLSPKIKDMVYPLNEYVKTCMRDHPSDELKVEQVRPVVPMLMQKEDQLIVLYGMGGNTDFHHTKKTIEMFSAYQRTLHLLSDLPEKVERIAYLLFTDADLKGIDYQVQRFKDNLSDVLKGLEGLQHNGKLLSDGNQVGCYVFSNPDGMGNLEDITLTIFQAGHETLFQEADGFLEKFNAFIPQKQKHHKKKAVLGIVGQLENPGASNVVHIARSAMLTDEKLQIHQQSREIASLLEQMFIQ